VGRDFHKGNSRAGKTHFWHVAAFPKIDPWLNIAAEKKNRTLASDKTGKSIISEIPVIVK